MCSSNCIIFVSTWRNRIKRIPRFVRSFPNKNSADTFERSLRDSHVYEDASFVPFERRPIRRTRVIREKHGDRSIWPGFMRSRSCLLSWQTSTRLSHRLRSFQVHQLTLQRANQRSWSLHWPRLMYRRVCLGVSRYASVEPASHHWLREFFLTFIYGVL